MSSAGRWAGDRGLTLTAHVGGYFQRASDSCPHLPCRPFFSPQQPCRSALLPHLTDDSLGLRAGRGPVRADTPVRPGGRPRGPGCTPPPLCQQNALSKGWQRQPRETSWQKGLKEVIAYFWGPVFSSTQWARGFPGGSGGKESDCQCRRHGFHPWSGKIPYATELLSLCTTIIRLCPRARELWLLSLWARESMPCNKRIHTAMKRCPHSSQRERDPGNSEDPARPKLNN